jgi:hypothetical protein
MAKRYSIGCVYRSGDACAHADQPHGPTPSGGVCAKVCKSYDGPPATCSVVDEPAPEPAKARAGTGCSPCAAAAKARLERKKHGAVEAMRILNEAMNAGE